MPEATVHLSSVAGSRLLDSAGARLGRVEDVIARLDQRERLPVVTGLKARIGGRELFVPADRIDRLEATAVRTATTKLNLAQFERRPGEVLLRSDVLDHSLIDVETARLVVAREVELICDAGVWRVGGIDPSIAAWWRRRVPRRFRGQMSDYSRFVQWSRLEPFVGHVPSARLRLTHRRLARLHAAQIADLVEAASHEEGEEIMNAVAIDKELEADILQELDEEDQVEFLRERSDEQVAAVLARMESDDAADLLMELDQDRRMPVLERLPPARRLKVKRLLGYNPQTAGGLMNPDFVSVPERSTVEQAIELVRRSETPAELTQNVVVVDEGGRLVGSVSIAALVRASGHEAVGGLVDSNSPSVPAETDVPEIARLMTDYNLMSMPVVDSEARPI